MSSPPLAIDLYCGLGGWAEGFLSEGFEVIGFDIEYRPYPGKNILDESTSSSVLLTREGGV